MPPNHDIFIRATLSNYRELRDYAQRLVADLADKDMLRQPVAGVTMNHAAWVLSHLSAYAPVLAAILHGHRGGEGGAIDPLNHEHGRSSRPLPDPTAYLPRTELIAHYCHVYDDAAAALQTTPPARFLEPTPIERWRPRFPTIADLPIQFLIKHNATHLGQLSAWRRACGLPPV